MTLPIPSNKRKAEFDQKLRKIEAEEKKLKELEAELERLQVRLATEASPLVRAYCDLRFENLSKLRDVLSDPFFKKKEKSAIQRMIRELAHGLKTAGDERAEEFFGSRVVDELDDDEEEYVEAPKYRPAPPPDQQAEGKVEIKALFRQLAKAFHPDKEKAEHLKAHKTSLMQKLTEAYENDDLYGLLKLEKEHLGERELSDDKLELYISHVNDRLKEVKAFEARLKKHGPLASIYQFVYNRKSTLQEFNVRYELEKIEQEVERERELQTMIWDRMSLREFLKH